ncbi:energy-coupling factor transporter transmembrane component T [Georgenia faecalis]|uniref:Energy-coupling factor transporter transmembrane component T n=1 Tax=Georgenia faecalis TaxID=2483799 RepID=A0ABV9DB80_9MICO|nr:energy-coupling factor transporter transmembrane component T [Georgenia faecalis]
MGPSAPAVPSPAPGVTLVRSGNAVRDLNPTTWAVAALVLAVVSQLWPLTSVAVAVGLCALLAAVAGRLGPFLRGWAGTVLLLSAVIVAMQLLFISGPTEVFRWGILTGTREGFERGLSFAGRIMGVGTPLVLLVQVLDGHRVRLELERRRVPPQAVYVVVAALHLIPVMSRQQAAILDAQRARGVETDANWFVRARAFLPTLIPLILSSILGVEEKALALESRAFTVRGPRTSLYAVTDSGLDRALRWALAAALVGALVVRIAW